MKFHQILVTAIIATALFGCQQVQDNPQVLSKAGEKMQAAMRACVVEDLNRKNAVAQTDCVDDAKRRAGYEINSPCMWLIERTIAADHASVMQYAAGKMSRRTFIEAYEKHWADAVRTDNEAIARSNQIIDAETLAQAGRDECRGKRHAGIFKTYAESAECSNPLIIAAYEQVKFPYMDLVRNYTKKRLQILKKLDAQEITSAQSTADIQKAFDSFEAKTHRRDLKKGLVKRADKEKQNG